MSNQAKFAIMTRIIPLFILLSLLSSFVWSQTPVGGDFQANSSTVADAQGLGTIWNDDLFTDIGADLTGVYGSSVAWGDYDNDGDLDIVLTGEADSWGHVSKVYRNDGGGTFTDIGADLTEVHAGSVAWGDYDNDGDLDILLTGYSYLDIHYRAEVYRNDGGGAFTDISAALTGVDISSVAWGDYDNDGDLDILLTGYTGSADVSKVYRNDGGGTFTDIGAALIGVCFSSVAWGDYDNDGDLDILLTGQTGSSDYVSKVYRNDGGSTFTDIGADLPGVVLGSVAWGDCDNDGDLDILLTGYWNLGSPYYISKVYRNDGGGTFTDIGADLPGVINSSVAWGDYDNDGDLDILLAGDSGWGYVSKVYRNDSPVANAGPEPPTGLGASTSTGGATLSWQVSTDGQTPSAGLTYNLRVGTTPGGAGVVSPMASSTGYRKVARRGNADHTAPRPSSGPSRVAPTTGAFRRSIRPLRDLRSRPSRASGRLRPSRSTTSRSPRVTPGRPLPCSR